jgi:glucose-6-phosphate 1-dehydrogenase
VHITNIESCRATLFIFGATRGLATKKILPSLQQWYGDETPFAKIWCLGRRPLDKAAYFALIESKGGFQLSDVLKNHIGYHCLELDDSPAYTALANSLDEETSTAQRLFFLAVKLDTFLTITTKLHATGLFIKDRTTIACCSKNPSAIAWKLHGKSNPILSLWRQKNNCTGSTIT